MDHSAKSIAFTCTFQTSTGAYLRAPGGAGVLETSDRPDDYAIFHYTGDDGLIALEKFPDLYVGCTPDTGLLTTVDESGATPFTIAQSGAEEEPTSTMTGQVQATGGPYKGEVWYYLGAFKRQVEMIAKPTNPGSAKFTMTITDTSRGK